MNEITSLGHIYITVSDMLRSEVFYDCVMTVLGFHKNTFAIDGEPHIEYFNRHFAYILRPAKESIMHDDCHLSNSHQFCFRVDSVADVHAIADDLRSAGIYATKPRLYPQYASDYWATYFSDPDGIRLEVTNYRLERRGTAHHELSVISALRDEIRMKS
jgi:glyoxylase I family protein